MQPNKMEPP